MKNLTGACCGSYDGDLHPGHIRFLKKAQSFCTDLHVFIVPDWVIERNKKRLPLLKQQQRVDQLLDKGIARLIHPLVGSDEDHLKQILAIKPHVYIFSEDQKTPWDILLEEKLLEQNIKIVKIPRYKPHLYSTTKLHFSKSSTWKVEQPRHLLDKA